VGRLETSHDIDALISELRALDDGDVWMLGGGKLQSAFLERGALDDIEIYVMPEIIGGGTPLFPPTGLRVSPRLEEAKTLDRGCVYLRYSFS
jgi:dihydrofolate reductase